MAVDVATYHGKELPEVLGKDHLGGAPQFPAQVLEGLNSAVSVGFWNQTTEGGLGRGPTTDRDTHKL